MSLTKTIEIDGKQVPFRASAAIPRIYRLKFNRDIYRDLATLEKAVGEGDQDSSNMDLFSLEMFENIAYVMAKHADPSIPDTPEEWLDDAFQECIERSTDFYTTGKNELISHWQKCVECNGSYFD